MVAARETTLQELLEGAKQYQVPLYQRTYSWKQTQLERLWKDVLQLAEDRVSLPGADAFHRVAGARAEPGQRGRRGDGVPGRRRTAAADHSVSSALRDTRPPRADRGPAAPGADQRPVLDEPVEARAEQAQAASRPRPTEPPTWLAWTPRRRPAGLTRLALRTGSSGPSWSPAMTRGPGRYRAHRERGHLGPGSGLRDRSARRQCAPDLRVAEQHRHAADPRRPAAQLPVHAAADPRGDGVPVAMAAAAGACCRAPSWSSCSGSTWSSAIRGEADRHLHGAAGPARQADLRGRDRGGDRPLRAPRGAAQDAAEPGSRARSRRSGSAWSASARGAPPRCIRCC